MDPATARVPPPPPGPNTEGEHATAAAQILDAERVQKDGVVQAIENGGDEPAKPKDASKGGMKNYFVCYSNTIVSFTSILTITAQRVFTYGTKLDFLLMSLCAVTSIGSGVAFPLMTVVFGQLVGTFTDYFIPGTTITSGEFQDEVNNLTLYLVYLFIAKFALSYISMV